jgi:hypothetical protein
LISLPTCCHSVACGNTPDNAIGYDVPGNVIETRQHKRDFKEWLERLKKLFADANSYGPQEPCLPPEMISCWLLPSAFMIQIPPDAVHEMWEPSGDQEGS